MSIATAIQTAQQRVAAAYDKIQERGGILPEYANLANMPDAIDSIPSGNVNELEPGVHFIDYDGTPVGFWPSADVSGKTALPGNPSHTGLVAQGWNWDLEHIKSYMTNHPLAPLYVGQMYDTESGLSEFDITLTKVTGKTVTFSLSGEKDWGDGTSDTATSHTYEDYGDYTIKYGGAISKNIFGTSGNGRYLCIAARISSRVTTIGANALQSCFSLTSITMPKEVTSLGNYTLNGARKLSFIVLPKNVTALPQNFTSGYSLRVVSFPPELITFGFGALANCTSLVLCVLPDGVTSIGAQGLRYSETMAYFTASRALQLINNLSMQNLYSARVLDFSAVSQIPSLSSAENLTNLPPGCKILVPAALYDEWITATNWTEFADYIYPV